MRARADALRRVAVVVLAVAALFALAALPAGAGVDPPPTTANANPNAPGLVLIGQPAWVPVGTNLPLRLQVRGQAAGTPGLTVSATAHEAVSSRSGFQAAVEGRNLGSVLGQAELPLDLFPAGDDGSRTLNFPLQAEDASPDPNALQLRRTGVYPVEVELRQPDGTRLAGFVTPVVAVAPGANGGAAIGQRLGVSWVVPMTAPPAYQADGKPDPSVVSQLRPEGRLGRRAIAIANSGVPLTIAPGPESLESWTQLANGDPGLTTSLNAMRDALGRSQVLAGAYVPVDVRSLVSGGLSAEVGPELVQGTDKLSALLGTRGRSQNRDRAPRQRRFTRTPARRRRRPRRSWTAPISPRATSSSRPRNPSPCAINRQRPWPSGRTPVCSVSSRATTRRPYGPSGSSRGCRSSHSSNRMSDGGLSSSSRTTGMRAARSSSLRWPG